MGYTIRTQTFNEPVALSDVVKFYESDYSTEEVTIVSGAGVLEIGTVLGRITASGNWNACNVDATDGSQAAAGILAERIDATSGARQAIVIVRRATVSLLGLRWHANTNTTNERNAAIAQLAALGIITREGA